MRQRRNLYTYILMDRNRLVRAYQGVDQRRIVRIKATLASHLALWLSHPEYGQLHFHWGYVFPLMLRMGYDDLIELSDLGPINLVTMMPEAMYTSDIPYLLSLFTRIKVPTHVG